MIDFAPLPDATPVCGKMKKDGANDSREHYKELPALITQDPQIRDWVWHLIHEQAMPRAEAESRFERILAELQRMREEQERRWEENDRRSYCRTRGVFR